MLVFIAGIAGAQQPGIEAAAKLRFSEKADALPVAVGYETLHLLMKGREERLSYDVVKQQVTGITSRRTAATEQPPPKPREVKELVSAALHVLPSEAIASPQGVFLRFSSTLDTSWAADLDHWSFQGGQAQGAAKLTGISIGTDDRSVFLMIDGIAPGTRLQIGYELRIVEGSTMAAVMTGLITAGEP
jgi:hypothetical protein